jgi:hypothetical protein
VQDLIAGRLTFKGTFDRFALALDAANAGEELFLFVDSM